MDIVRWGFLSTAKINRKLISAIRASSRGMVVAVASRDEEKAEAYARKWNIPYAFGSYQALLESEQIDCVYISLPNHLHAEWSIRALQAGKHVLCEKPLAISVDEVDRMIAASQENQRVLSEAFMYRHHPQTKIAGDWAHTGKLGDIVLVRSTFHFRVDDRAIVQLVPEYGGGCLWDVGVYPISFAQFIYGEAPSLVIGYQSLGDTGVDETFIGQMVYSDGRMAQFSSSFRSPFYTTAEVIGTDGRLYLNRPFSEMDRDRHLFFIPKKGELEEIPVPEQELYRGEIEDMHAAILDGKRPYIRLEESRNHIRTVVALYQAAREMRSYSLENLSGE